MAVEATEEWQTASSRGMVGACDGRVRQGHDYTLAADTLVTANVTTATPDQRTITISKPSTTGAADDTTILQVEGNDIDAEKMSLGALADGFAVKVKGDTFKRSGIPNSRFEILQQGFVPDAHGGGHCEMQVSEPVMLST